MYYVYILECRDGSLYTGISNRLAERVEKHNTGKASRCTAARRPVRLIYSEEQPDKSAALKREAAIKNLSRLEKMALIARN
jgi:putative endonuclease